MTTAELPLADYKRYLQSILPAVETLYYRSDNLAEIFSRPRVAIVGNRKLSAYGRQVTEWFAGNLARQGVVIISGLAYGIDAVAHRAALEAGGITAAVLPGSIERIYPAAHRHLADEMLQQGGALFSEYPAGNDITYKNQFIDRNRIVSGLADLLLITEAGVKSGSLHTANFAIEQGKHIMVVPGNIYSPGSAGVHNLLRQSQAAVATSPDDVLQALNLTAGQIGLDLTSTDPVEVSILRLLSSGITDGDQLCRRSGVGQTVFNRSLTMLELYGRIQPIGNNHWTLR